MVDISPPATGIKGHFSQQAQLPTRQLSIAEQFVDALKKASEKGQAPSAEFVAEGKALLQNIEEKLEVSAFSATVLAGQEAATEDDLDQRLSIVTEGLERAQLTADRLRSTLKTFL
jgi:hypothetical protein